MGREITRGEKVRTNAGRDRHLPGNGFKRSAGKVRLRYDHEKHPGKFMFCVGNPKGINPAKRIAKYILEQM